MCGAGEIMLLITVLHALWTTIQLTKITTTKYCILKLFIFAGEGTSKPIISRGNNLIFKPKYTKHSRYPIYYKVIAHLGRIYPLNEVPLTPYSCEFMR